MQQIGKNGNYERKINGWTQRMECQRLTDVCIP